VRGDNEAFAGKITGTVDGEPVSIPVLRIKHAEEWRTELEVQAAVVGTTIFEGLPGMLGMSSSMVDAMLELVIAYDRSGVLGGKEAFIEKASDGEAWLLFKEMVDASYPFVDDLNRMGLLLSKVTSAPSSSGLSLIGGSTRPESPSD
jgi:hypothetical protein